MIQEQRKTLILRNITFSNRTLTYTVEVALYPLERISTTVVSTHSIVEQFYHFGKGNTYCVFRAWRTSPTVLDDPVLKVMLDMTSSSPDYLRGAY